VRAEQRDGATPSMPPPLLSNVARLVVTFNPACSAARGARELLSRLRSSRAAAATPDAVVEARLDGALGAPSIEVTTSGGKSRATIEAAGQSADALAARVAAAAAGGGSVAGSPVDVLKGSKLIAGWGAGGRHDAGAPTKTPVG